MDLKRHLIWIALVSLGSGPVRQTIAASDRFDLVAEPSAALVVDNNDRIVVGRLWFFGNDGVRMPTNEAYLILERNGYPTIEDKFDGHHFALQLMDVDQRTLAAVFFSAGGNQLVLRLYELNPSGMVPFSSQPISSNMRSITVDRNVVEVRNQVIDAGVPSISVDRFRIEGRDCVRADP